MGPALETYDRVIELGGADAAVWLEVGRTLADVRENAQALDALANSQKLAPSAEATYEIARSSFQLGDLEGAKQNFESVAHETDSAQAWLSLAKIIPGVPSATHQTVREVRAAFAERLRREVGTAASQPRPMHKSSGDRLRVGYLSAFFERANYMKPVWGLVNHHDRSRFEIHLFSDTPLGNGWEGYQANPADSVHEVAKLDHLALARLIRECQIDILIDLNGYSAADRLPLFLEPTAPIVAAWFNMYGTSGLPGIDWIIGDREVVRESEESEYTERVACLPGSYLTFEVGHRAPPIVAPPCTNSRQFTFGSLVSQYKITHVVLDAWADILRQADSSRLVLANRALRSTCNREYLLRQFWDRGVASERLVFLGPAEHYDFLNYYRQIDLALDAFPYNGGTTTMEAIWQGVPVLTFDGDRWASRTSQTLLRRTHLADFVAAGPREYVETAVTIARDPQAPSRLATLRADMRDRLLASPACDVAGLASAMERIYVQAAHDVFAKS
jgi:predicted O-linked N-acetylglucosamine transferase (SPINDLY family)